MSDTPVCSTCEGTGLRGFGAPGVGPCPDCVCCHEPTIQRLHARRHELLRSERLEGLSHDEIVEMRTILDAIDGIEMAQFRRAGNPIADVNDDGLRTERDVKEAEARGVEQALAIVQHQQRKWRANYDLGDTGVIVVGELGRCVARIRALLPADHEKDAKQVKK